MKALAVLLVALLPLGAWGGEAVPTEQDPVHEKRAVRLGEQLRCLVCQNQTIAESNAGLAQDLRRQVREQIAQGRSDREIVDFMVQLYGDFVLSQPPVKATTLLLWFGPPLLLLAGIAVLARNLRERRKRAAEAPITETEHRQARKLLGGSDDETA